ncbi:RNA-dependent RNA polymerase [Botrytis cinerea negative-stranded RNA virus 5]|uniref:RNA-directed RNA polymerase n=1 Tax=Botrytis cinerea negative-stranded RNA virus 5 TaxID=2735940 RepID=A0AAE7AKN1_9MONO|nr:RNA-dependent RNA polymerase [Botrytis cinerea negative-stranded RNA virus 5]QJT73701.1 RNA-dependent RNA polymerase [Botrytis cinerea negative-stranded RNA virus 5]
MDNLLFDDEEYRAIRRFFPSYILDSPLMRHSSDRFVAALRMKIKRSDSKLIQNTIYTIDRFRNKFPNIDKVPVTVLETTDRFYFLRCLTQEIRQELTPGYIPKLREDLVDSNRMIDVINHNMSKLFGLSGAVPRNVPVSKEVLDNLVSYEFLENGVQRLRNFKKNGNRDLVLIATKSYKILIDDQIVLIRYPEGAWITSYDDFLGFQDMFRTRALALYGADAQYPGLSDKILVQLHIQENIVTRFGDKGYDLVKSPEALAKCLLSVRCNDIITVSYDNVKRKYYEKERELGGSGKFISSIIKNLESCDNLRFISELGGLIKTASFPIVDPAVGGKSAQSHGTANKPLDLQEVFNTKYRVAEMILRGYIEEHSDWPPLDFQPEGKKTRLYKLYQKRVPILPKNSYPLKDWMYCQFEKFLEFDYYPNYLELMDDKSMSKYRSKMSDSYTGNSDKTGIYSHKVLLSMLARNNMNPKEIVRRMVYEKIPFEWLIICLYPKEKEFKIAPRMFCMLVFEVRWFFSLAEHNLKQVLKYLPQQTMTSSKEKVTRRFVQMTKEVGSNSDRFRVYIEVDLTRWNLLMRGLVVDRVGLVLNQTFGLDAYTVAHKFFSSSQILVRVGDCPPEGMRPGVHTLPESDLAWGPKNPHLGGFEGIIQKQWTIVTIAAMENSLSGLDVEFQLTGQGDNQVLNLYFKKSQYPTVSDQKALISKVEERLEKTFQRINHIVKPEENIVSTTVVTYSKRIWCSQRSLETGAVTGAVPMDPSLKFLSKACSASDSYVPSISGEYTALASSFLAAGEHFPNPLLMYGISLWFAPRWLRRRFLLDNIPLPKKDIMRALAIIPASLGGIGFNTIADYMCRGSSDPLSGAFGGLKMLTGIPLIKGYRGYLETRLPYSEKPNLMSLIEDPFSLPFKKPLTAANSSAKAKREIVRELSYSNPHIYSLFDIADQQYTDLFESSLISSNPFYVLPLHDILKASAIGVRKEFETMFTSTRTMQDLAAQDRRVDFGGNIILQDNKTINYCISLVEDSAKRKLRTKYSSIFETVTALRKFWFNDGRTVEGITTLHPFDSKIEYTNKVPGITALFTDDPNHCVKHRGQIDPYIGARTKEKRGDYGIKVVTKDPASKAAKKMALLWSQLPGNQNWKSLIKTVVETRVGLKFEKVEKIMPHVFGGISAHRYDAMESRKKFALSMPYTVATNVLLSNDNTGDLVAGYEDYPMPFQQWMCTLLFCANIHALNGKTSRLMNLTTDSLVLEPLVSHSVDTSIAPPPPVNLGLNPLVYSSNIMFEARHDAANSELVKLINPSNYSIDDLMDVGVGSILNEMSSPSTARINLFSDVYGRLSGETWDLRECLGFTAERLVMMSTRATAIFFIDKYFSKYLRKDNVSIQQLLSKIVPSSFSLWLPQITHSEFYKDDFVKTFNLVIPPGAQAAYTLSKSIAGIIIKNVWNKIRTKSFIRSLNFCIGADSKHLTLSKAYCLNQCIRLYESVADTDGHLLAETVYSMSIVVDKAKSLASKLTSQAEKINLYASEFETYFSNKYIRSFRTHKVQLLQLTFSEALRNARKFCVKETEVLIPPLSLQCSTHYITKLTKRPVQAGIRSLPPLTSTDSFLKRFERNMAKFSSNKFTGVFSKSLDVIHCAKHHYPSHFRKTLVVGSGQGGFARGLLELTNSRIELLDLQSSIPNIAHRFSTWLPPACVQSNRLNDRIAVTSETYSTSGDWTDPDISAQVLENNYDTVVIDIEKGVERFDLSLLSPLAGIHDDLLIILKLVLTQEEAQLIYEDLIVSGYEVLGLTAESITTYSHCYFIVKPIRPIILSKGTSFINNHVLFPIHLHSEVVFSSLQEKLSDICNPWPAKDSISGSLELLLSTYMAFKTAKRQITDKYSYAKLVSGILQLQLCIEYQDLSTSELKFEVQTLSQAKFVKRSFGSTVIVSKMTDKFKQELCTTLPQLLGHVF